MATENRLEGADLSDDGGPLVTVDLDAGAVAAPASQARRAALAAVEQQLRDEPQTFGFFQAVRLLERLFPDRARVGGFDDPAREVVRFGVPPTLGFPPGEIADLEIDERGPTAMAVNFMGLTGPQGVLPWTYSLLAHERLRDGDAAFADFLDIFHHRILSLFYQAWRKYQFAIAREEGAGDRLAERLLDIIGLGLPEYRALLPVPDEALFFRAGLLAPQPRSAAALRQLVEDFLEVPCIVEEFVGGWFGLTEPDRCALGDDDDPCNVLGGAVVGDEIWDAQARVRLRLGPLTRTQYDALLPGGDGYAAVAALLRFFSHDQFEFELQLVLARDDVPGVALGAADDTQRLGWSTWLRTAPRHDDADETVLTLDPGSVS